MRGENTPMSCHMKIVSGTSPRARGKPRYAGELCEMGGNIPACAGKTECSIDRAGEAGEHPRVRGENFCRSMSYSCYLGTSPRARGKRATGGNDGGRGRNIPACAGKTFIDLTSRFNRQEHPRVRGENWRLKDELQRLQGTSPRARGKLPSTASSRSRKRNIPACAGKTVPPWLTTRSPWEHPRVRGENPKDNFLPSERPGTSPRARGKLQSSCA